MLSNIIASIRASELRAAQQREVAERFERMSEFDTYTRLAHGELDDSDALEFSRVDSSWYREGSIHQRSKTRWVAMLSLGYNAQGRRKRRAIYGTTKREAQEKLAKLQQASAFDRFPMRRPVRHLDSTRGRAKSASVKSTEVPVVNGQRAHDPGN